MNIVRLNGNPKAGWGKVGVGGGRQKAWDRETMFLQLAKQSASQISRFQKERENVRRQRSSKRSASTMLNNRF